MPAERPTVVVLGMHRSGTSLASGLLDLAGVDFGPRTDFIATNDENPKGFWERQDVRALNDRLLHAAGCEWNEISTFDVETIPAAVVAEFENSARRILEGLLARGNAGPIGLKEPRLCLLAPLWRPVLSAPVFYLVVHRDPLEIAVSLANRNGIPHEVSHFLTESYLARVVETVRDQPHAIVSYQEMLRQPAVLLERVGAALRSLGWDMAAPDAAALEAFASEELYRSHPGGGERPLGPGLRRISSALQAGRLPDGPLPVPEPPAAILVWERRNRFREFCRVRDELAKSRGRQSARMQEFTGQGDRARAQLRARNEVSATLRNQLDQLEHSLDSLSLDKRGLENERYGLELRLEDLSGQLSAALASNAVARKRVDDLEQRHRRLDQENRALAKRARWLEKDLQDLRRSLSWRITAPLRKALDFITGATPAALQETPQPALVRSRRSEPERKLPLTALVIAWDAGHNPLGRAYMLGEVLSRFIRNVVIIGFQFPRYGTDTWEPLRNSRIPVITLPGSDFPEFLAALENIAARFDPDIVFACKARLPSLQLGALFKRRLGCPLVLDIDDHEGTFFENWREIDGSDLADAKPGTDGLQEPFGRFWTGYATQARHLADRLLVSNPALERLYGGLVVPHVRDEQQFEPGRFDRAAVRARFGIPADAKVVLFFGTPRRHKGLDRVAQAVLDLGDEKALLVVVGQAPDPGDLDRLQKLAGDRVRLIGNQPFGQLPEIVSLGDAVCLLQDLEHPISRYQLPAKAIDAIAMNLPLLVTRTGPLNWLVAHGLATAVTDENLGVRLREALRGQPADAASRRQAFLDHFSYAAAASRLRPLVAELVEGASETPGFAGEVDRLLAEQRRLFGAPSERAVPGSGTNRAVVVFWKQNDSTLYGRRVDMLIKYLAARDDVDRVVVFDAPISEFDLLRMRRSTNSLAQHRLVYQRTYEKLLGKLDSAKISYNVFVHPPGNTGGYRAYIEQVLDREGVAPGRAVFWFYPKNFRAGQIIRHFKPARVAVDVVDDHREWPGIDPEYAEKLTGNYQELLGTADVAFVNCRPMLDKMAPMARAIHLVENGCDASPPAVPPRHSAAYAQLMQWSGKVIGFVGNLEAKIDIDLLEKIAHTYPDCKLLLIGSTHANDNTLHLASLPNVIMPGVVPYPEVGAWLRRFDVGIVPHLHIGMTENMNPLKIFVYLQWGVPVVATDIPNIGYRGRLLTTAADHEEFLEAIGEFLQNPPADIEAERSTFVAANDWQSRFKEHVDRLLDGLPD